MKNLTTNIKGFTEHLIPVILLVFLGFTLSSCVHKKIKSKKGRIIASVGNKTLTLKEARDGVPETVYNQDSLKALTNYRNNWVKKQLLVQEANRIGLEHNPIVKKRIRRIRNDALAEALREFILKKTDSLKVTPQEISNYYEANKNQFILNEEYVRFRHMVTNNLKDCQQAKADLLHGIPWKEVVQKYGVNKKEILANSKRYWPISLAVKEYPLLHRYLKIIGLKEISPIRMIDGHYHFVQLISRRAKGSHPDIKWVFGQIKDWLKLQKRRKILRNYERNLYLKAKANNELYISNKFLKIKPDSSHLATVKDTLSSH